MLLGYIHGLCSSDTNVKHPDTTCYVPKFNVLSCLTQRVVFTISTCRVCKIILRGLIKPLDIPLQEKCLPTDIGLNNHKMFTMGCNTSW